MPLPRFHKLSPADQDRLLSTATREFATHGYAGASLNSVIARAKLSKGVLYYYFADKDDLYAAVVARVFGEVQRALGLPFEPKSRATFWADLEASTFKAFQLGREHPEEMQAIRSFQRDLRRHRRPAFEPVLEQVRLHLRRLVQAGRALGCVRTDLDEDTLVDLLDALDEVFDAKLFAETAPLSRAAERRYVRLYVDLTRRLIAPVPLKRKASRL